MLDVDVTSLFKDYEVPENVCEWSWIENNASFRHVHNAESGIWEFIVSTAMIQDDLSSVPKALMPTVSGALSEGYSYILFHQGT